MSDRTNGKKFYATVTFFLPAKTDGRQAWEVKIFAATQGGLKWEAIRVAQNYKKKYNAPCKVWKYEGPDGFVRLMNQWKSDQKAFALANGQST
tara:strand:+ start:71 stop:349 length:279 start_codon:yes stop_codon:yes gene_type:complete